MRGHNAQFDCLTQFPRPAPFFLSKNKTMATGFIAVRQPFKLLARQQRSTKPAASSSSTMRAFAPTLTTSPLSSASSSPALRLLRLRPSVVATSAAAANSSGGDVQGEMLSPSLFNKPAVRAVAIAAGVAAAAAGTGAASSAATLAAVHLTAFSISLGTQIYTTFFLGIAMFKSLGRQAFGRLQSKLFPIYFSVVAASTLFQTASLAFGPGVLGPQAVSLGVTLGATLINLLVIEPTTTKSMFERYALENAPAASRDDARIARLRKEFSKLHGISSLFNLAALVACVAHGAWLASHLSLPTGGWALVSPLVK